MDTLGRKIQIYRGLETSLPVLEDGELGYTYDENGGSKKLWVGSSDGVNHRIQAEQYIIDDLVSNVADGALSARQGKILKDMIDAIGAGGASVNVVDNLLSNSPISALSARMGKVLNEKIINHENNANSQKHIELVDEEPVDLANTGVVFLRRDETSENVPSQPTLDELKQEINRIESNLTSHETKIASSTELGHIKIGDNLTITEDGVLNASSGEISDASNATKGIIQVGENLTISSGILSVPVATKTVAGAIKVTDTFSDDSKDVAASAFLTKYLLDNTANKNELSAKANQVQSPSVVCTLSSGWAHGSSQLKYFKDQFGIVHLYGSVIKSSGGTTITTLPVGNRPIDRVNIIVMEGDDSTSKIGLLGIDASGNVLSQTTRNCYISVSFRAQ